MLPETDDPVAIAGDDAIQSFRDAFSDALYDTGHPEHDRRLRELTGLMEKRFGGEPTVVDPHNGTERPETTLDEAIVEAMEPLSADKFDIGPDSTFALNVDTRPVEEKGFGWDSALEANARAAFERASLNQAEALSLARAYAEVLPGDYDTAKGVEDTMRNLKQEFGDRTGAVLEGTERMLADYVPPNLREFIRTSRLGKNPNFVNLAVRFAQKKGYVR